jgi:hypothetical protein
MRVTDKGHDKARGGMNQAFKKYTVWLRQKTLTDSSLVPGCSLSVSLYTSLNIHLEYQSIVQRSLLSRQNPSSST